MNRTTRTLALTGVGLALLFFATGAKRQEDEDETEGGDEGYGKADPTSPPKDDRDTPSQPGARPGEPKGRPPGNNIIPNPQRTGLGGAGSLFIGTSEWPYVPLDLVQARDPDEYAEGVLIVLLPWSSSEAAQREALTNLELIIEDWAELYGYRVVHFVYDVPESEAYTAESWYQGQRLGVYDLEVSYLPAYLQELGKISGALPLAFAAGLSNWLHGA